MMRRACLLAAALLAACSSTKAPEPAELPRLVKPQEVKVLWTQGIEWADQFFFSPAVDGDAVFAAGVDGTVARFDAKTGRRAWRINAEMMLSGGVGAGGGVVVVASDKGEVAAFDTATGKERWRARVSSEVIAPPVVGAEMVLVRSVDSRIFAFGAADGKRRWVYQRPPSPLGLRVPAAMTVAEDSVYAGFRGGKLVALALSNGAVRWEATVAVPKGTTELERVVDVVGEPAVQGREVCAASYQGRLACFERANGNQIWARDLSSVTGVSLDARYAFVSDDRGAVHAFDRSSGRSVWKQDKLFLRQLSQPQPVGGAIVVGDFEGAVHFLSRDTGEFLARYESNNGAVRTTPVPLPAGLLVQTVDGGLYALAL